jgi:glycosyltransferase involved in cell wall biosynthesis
VLFVHTATSGHLGADTWIHSQIMAGLDRSTFEVHAACTPGREGHRTPTFQLLSQIPGVHLRAADLGPELEYIRGWEWIRRALATVPAPFHLIGLARYIRRHRISIIATSDRPRDALAAVILGRMTRATSIIHVHVRYAAWMSPLLKWSLKRADVLVSVSRFVAGTLEASGHDPARIRVALNGIDLSQWHPRQGRAEMREELGIPEGAPLVVTACRLFRSKGPAELIRALAACRDDHPDAKLAIVGQPMEWGFADELVALAKQLEMSDRVVLTGHRPDVPRFMAAADVFAMPSIDEPFGLVFAEAMAMELPVVALRSGGAPEIIEHGVTGLLAAPDDPDDLAGCLSVLLADPLLRRCMGVAGRRRVEADFTVQRMACDVAAIYHESRRARQPYWRDVWRRMASRVSDARRRAYTATSASAST